MVERTQVVLYIDDRADRAAALAEAFKRHGIRVAHCSSALAALDVVNGRLLAPSAIITQQILPDFDCVDFATLLTAERLPPTFVIAARDLGLASTDAFAHVFDGSASLPEIVHTVLSLARRFPSDPCSKAA